MRGSGAVADRIEATRTRAAESENLAGVTQERADEAYTHRAQQNDLALEKADIQIDGQRNKVETGLQSRNLAQTMLSENFELYRIRYFLHQLAIDFQEFAGKAEARTRMQKVMDEVLSSIGKAFSRLAASKLGELGGRIYAQGFEAARELNLGVDRPVDFGELMRSWNEVIQGRQRLQQLEVQVKELFADLESALRQRENTKEEGEVQLAEIESEFRAKIEEIFSKATELSREADALESGLPSPT
ncbi:MAG: hypothetical protein A3I05_03575 [Deltaproteobacteria bacterium RIFCSPLOWO2_02_FULL_44_10]|nr:MAG: hypothetical protein A3C46_03150 [Deltaproteobacteria bacterium RIFCSPHIGHO2_02_FULL_44_16]OGQ46250.1 MAG: hypothetical protein A3I05_03575 [Deltaproteobacteria bacterium RIFCSPLOWO2_02_FULL_44_10]